MTPCPDSAMLERFLAGELEDAEQEVIDAHMEACSQCQEDLERLTANDKGASILHVLQGGLGEGGSSSVAAETAAPTGNSDKIGSFGSNGRYQRLDEVAQGGMGVIYRCHDTNLNRELAVKVLQEKFRGHANVEARFRLEAELLGSLQHPNIPPIHEQGRMPDGLPYFTMKLVKGRTLADLLRESTDLAVDRTRFLRYFVQVCQTLAYAHAQGVLHRDLKPHNIMVGAFDEVQVMDWGLAKQQPKHPQPEGAAALVETANDVDQTQVQPGRPLGTPAYMSPEQAGAKDEIGPASDIYSLGAMLYKILTRRAPFAGTDKIQVQECVRLGAFKRPRQVEPGIPAALEAICLKAMALRPEQRYPSAKALVLDVRRWLADEPVAVHRDSWRMRAGRWRRRHRTLAASGFVALLAAVLGAAVTAFNVHRDQIRRERDQIRREEASVKDLAVVETLLRQGQVKEAKDLLARVCDAWGNNEQTKHRQQIQTLQKDAKVKELLGSSSHALMFLTDQALHRTTFLSRPDHTRQPVREIVETLRKAHIDFENDSPAVLATQIRNSTIQDDWLAALFNYVALTDENWLRDKLINVAVETVIVDGNAEQERLRDPKLRSNPAALKQFADGLELRELSPQFVYVVARVLRHHRSDATEPFLRRAVERRPQDFWLNLGRGVLVLHRT